ncbi:MAG TPA: CoA ester lyase [Rhizomicrobium sp.]|nr:CoA ester lyase [Rhizomicrobium sp.]
MRLRSLLFVPGDRPDRMAKAAAAGADALILDLEDSVAAEKKTDARQAVVMFLAGRRTLPLFVRINGANADQDLKAIIPAKPDGIVLPKAEGGNSVAELDRRLEALGDTHALILPIATETPVAIFALGSYGGVTSRLCGLSWGVEDLSAAIGAATARDENGHYTPLFETVRALALFAARAAGVAAIETIYPALNDEEGLRAYAGRGHRDGFSGMLATHPAQIPVINRAFTPSAEEIAWARRVIDAFAANPKSGVLKLGGQMLDAPHLARARNILSSSNNK